MEMDQIVKRIFMKTRSKFEYGASVFNYAENHACNRYRVYNEELNDRRLPKKSSTKPLCSLRMLPPNLRRGTYHLLQKI